jgi:hypothetical protein
MGDQEIKRLVALALPRKGQTFIGPLFIDLGGYATGSGREVSDEN